MSVVVEITTNSVQVTADAANTVAITETVNEVTVSAVGTQGPAGATGPAGPTGPAGAVGPGVPTGGTTGQVLSKINAADYNTQWINPPATDKPYYTTGNAFPIGNSIGTAADLTSNPGYSNHCLILLDASAASGSGVLLGVPAINRQIVLVNESPETISIYPSAGTSIHPDELAAPNTVYYLRGYATLKLIGRDTTSWRIQEPIVDLAKNNVFGLLPITKGGTGTIDGSGLPYLGKFGNSGDPAQGSYFFDVQVFGQFQIYDGNSPTFDGFTFLSDTTDPYLFEMRTIYGGGRVLASDSNNLLVYFGGTAGGADGLAWDAGTNRLQTFGTFLVGNWEFDGVDALNNSDGVLTAAQLKYWDSTAFDLSNTGINFMNSGVNINTFGNLGVGASAAATHKIFSLSTTSNQLVLAYNNTTALVKYQVDSSGQLLITPGVDRANGFSWRNAAATTTIFKIDTLNTEISMGIGANTIGFFKGGSSVTPNVSIGASGGKAVALLAGTSGSAFAYDSTGTFAIATDTRANIVAGTSSGGTQRIGMTSAGLVMIGAGTSTSQLTVQTATPNADIFTIANSDATTGNGYTFKVSNGSGGGLQKNLVIRGGSSSNDAVIFENTMGVYMGTTVGTNNGVYIGDNNNTNQNPKALLHVGIDTATMPTIDANTGLIISNASATGDSASLSIIAGATGFSTVNFGDTADENVGYMQYAHSTNTFSFGVNTNPALYIDSAGVGVGVAANDKFTVGSSVNGTNITMGLRTLSGGGSSVRTLFTHSATTGALSLAIDQGGNGSARAFSIDLSAVTNAFYIASTGDVILGAAAASGNKFSILKTSTTVANMLVQDLGTGDAAIAFNVSGTSFSLGIDQSDSSLFKLSNSTTLGTSDVLTIAGSTGAVTLKTSASVGSSSAKNIFNASTATTVIDFDINASSTANNTFFRLGNGTMSTASSGVTNIISSTPSVNQSGTAGYTALNINVTETATGSGAKNLMLLRVGGTERFSVDNGGIVKASAQIRLKGYTVATLPAGTQGDTAFVTDALAPAFGVAIVGGGAVVTPVFYDGTNWTAR